MSENVIKQAAERIKAAKLAIAYTGAGISLESGVPTFRGSSDSVWNNYDPEDIEISHFLSNPRKSWKTINECFYAFLKENEIKPNTAHKVLAQMEAKGLVKSVITQNIDCLHQAAGSQDVIEFHGTTGTVSCTKCGKKYPVAEVNLAQEVPSCPACGGLLKPDFVFFGEGIPTEAYTRSFDLARDADLCIVVGTTGTVMPAAMIPMTVHQHGGTIIEVNPDESAITPYADIFIKTGAVDAFTRLAQELGL